LSVSTVFFLVGFSFATWASRIPTIRDDLALSNGQVALALIGFNSGIVLASLVVGGLVTRFGSRTILIISLMWYSAALPLIALAPTLPLLAAAMLLVAIGNCGVDITMNAQGSLVERAYGRPVLASFHAVFSLGALAGGGIGALVTSVHVSTLAHFTTVAVVMILIAVPAAPGLLRESSRTSGFGRNGTSRKRLSFPTSAILLPVVGSDGGAAAIGITVFSVGMLTGRLTADRIHRRFGTRAFIIACSATASVGAILVIATGTYVVCLIGAVVLGLGLAAIVPVVFSHSAAQDPERYGSAIAKVTAIGYTAFLTGPPIVGGLAEAFGLPTGMMTLPVLMLVMIILATRLRRASTVPP
jgi:MFS family permease